MLDKNYSLPIARFQDSRNAPKKAGFPRREQQKLASQLEDRKIPKMRAKQTGFPRRTHQKQTGFLITRSQESSIPWCAQRKFGFPIARIPDSSIACCAQTQVWLPNRKFLIFQVARKRTSGVATTRFQTFRSVHKKRGFSTAWFQESKMRSYKVWLPKCKVPGFQDMRKTDLAFQLQDSKILKAYSRMHFQNGCWKHISRSASWCHGRRCSRIKTYLCPHAGYNSRKDICEYITKCFLGYISTWKAIVQKHLAWYRLHFWTTHYGDKIQSHRLIYGEKSTLWACSLFRDI